MSILKFAKNLGIRHNVSLRVIDTLSGETIQEHSGHNAATNSLLTGIAHYLIGDGVLNQGYQMLSAYIPKYISLGTMGLINQSQDDAGLPSGIGETSYLKLTYNDLSLSQLKLLNKSASSSRISVEDDDILRCVDYMTHTPGYGADGYSNVYNNNRSKFGLGSVYSSAEPIKCELISSSFPRSKISFRDVVPESESEISETIDVVYSAMISTGALAQFRDSDNDYIFITEAGLWSDKDYSDSGVNGLLAGYRLAPPNQENWDMADPKTGSNNRELLKRSILKAGRNQVVQVIWKIQLGSVQQLTGMHRLYPEEDTKLKWIIK